MFFSQFALRYFGVGIGLIRDVRGGNIGGSVSSYTWRRVGNRQNSREQSSPHLSKWEIATCIYAVVEGLWQATSSNVATSVQ